MSTNTATTSVMMTTTTITAVAVSTKSFVAQVRPKEGRKLEESLKIKNSYVRSKPVEILDWISICICSVLILYLSRDEEDQKRLAIERMLYAEGII